MQASIGRCPRTASTPHFVLSVVEGLGDEGLACRVQGIPKTWFNSYCGFKRRLGKPCLASEKSSSSRTISFIYPNMCMYVYVFIHIYIYVCAYIYTLALECFLYRYFWANYTICVHGPLGE